MANAKFGWDLQIKSMPSGCDPLIKSMQSGRQPLINSEPWGEGYVPCALNGLKIPTDVSSDQSTMQTKFPLDLKGGRARLMRKGYFLMFWFLSLWNIMLINFMNIISSFINFNEHIYLKLHLAVGNLEQKIRLK